MDRQFRLESKTRDSWKDSEQMGELTVDCFASVENAALERFNSVRWCPGLEGVNCFTQDWKGELNYLCPPLGLVLRALTHLEEC